jgi:aryl carrier-like protein
MAARTDDSQQRRWAMQGVRALTPEQGCASLELLLDSNRVRAGVLSVDWSKLARHLPTNRPSSLISPLIPATVRQHNSTLEQLSQVSGAERNEVLMVYLREAVSRVLGLKESQVDGEKMLNALGLDSLMAVELKNRFQSDLGVDISIAELIEEISLSDLAGRISQKLGDRLTAASFASASNTSQKYTNVDLSELESMLQEEKPEIARKIAIISDKKVDSWLHYLLS